MKEMDIYIISLINLHFWEKNVNFNMIADGNNNRLHLGLEWQPMKGLYGYYNNARFRDALLAGTFFQQDPLAEKYYPYSPYHYGINNPLKYVDVDGQKVISSEGNSVSFNMKMGDVRNYLGTHWQTLYNVMDKSPYLFKFVESQRYMTSVKYDTNNNMEITLEVNLNAGNVLSNGEKISPALSVLHEMGHGTQIANDIETYTKDVLTADDTYDNAEESRNIQQVENVVAKELGEPVRKTHVTTGYFYTNDVTEHKTITKP